MSRYTREQINAFDWWVSSLPEQWWVYVFDAGDGEHVKIGRTMHLAARQDQLRRPNSGIALPDLLIPQDLPNGRFIYFESDGYRKEKLWHNHFSEYRVGGEWFLKCPDEDNLYGVPTADEAEVDCIDWFVRGKQWATAQASGGWNPFDPSQHEETSSAAQRTAADAMSATWRSIFGSKAAS